MNSDKIHQCRCLYKVTNTDYKMVVRKDCRTILKTTKVKDKETKYQTKGNINLKDIVKDEDEEEEKNEGDQE